MNYTTKNKSEHREDKFARHPVQNSHTESPPDSPHQKTHRNPPEIPPENPPRRAQKNTPKPDRKIHLLKGPRHPEKPPKSGQGLQVLGPDLGGSRGGPRGGPRPPKMAILGLLLVRVLPSQEGLPGGPGGARGPRGVPGARNPGFPGGARGGPKSRISRKFPEIPPGNSPGPPGAPPDFPGNLGPGEKSRNLARGYF